MGGQTARTIVFSFQHSSSISIEASNSGWPDYAVSRQPTSHAVLCDLPNACCASAAMQSIWLNRYVADRWLAHSGLCEQPQTCEPSGSGTDSFRWDSSGLSTVFNGLACWHFASTISSHCTYLAHGVCCVLGLPLSRCGRLCPDGVCRHVLG